LFQSIATIQRKTTNTNDDDDLLRSPYENILKLGNNSINRSTEQKPKEETYEKLNFASNAYKAPIRSTNPFDDDIQKSSSPTNIPRQPLPSPTNVPQQPPPSPTNVPQQPPPPQAKAIVSDEPYWENTGEYHNKYSRIFLSYSSIFQ
jgi:hypothetical protein